MALSDDSISRAQLRCTVVDLLRQGCTLAADRVYDQRFWPLTSDNYPAILVATPIEVKENISPVHMGAPTFDTDVTIAISARTVSGSSRPNDQQKTQAETDLETLLSQIETLLLCTPVFLRQVQGIRSIHTQFTLSSEGSPIIGEASVLVTATIRQQYEPDLWVPLTNVEATIASAQTGETLAAFQTQEQPNVG